jgi:hypothetical protein
VARRAPEKPQNGAALTHAARIPRRAWPAVHGHLTRSGAPVGTGRTDHDRGELEVLTTSAGAQLLARLGHTVTTAPRRDPWLAVEQALAREVQRAARAPRARPAAPDPLERALARERDRLAAETPP